MKTSNECIPTKTFLLICLMVFMVLAILSRCSCPRCCEHRGYRFHRVDTDQGVFFDLVK